MINLLPPFVEIEGRVHWLRAIACNTIIASNSFGLIGECATNFIDSIFVSVDREITLPSLWLINVSAVASFLISIGGSK